jgi:type III restriction enzyme
VGKAGQLGGSIRCVVSVSMLTEGWDANTVTHVLGIRAFGTQLLCEQVIGRALRRQSYDLNEEGRFNVEYADVFGIPFDFTAKPVIAPPQPPRETVQVRAVRPERDALEIRFPRVEGYRVELPEDRLIAKFTAESHLELNPELVGPSITRNSGIIGEGVDLTLAHLGEMRTATLAFKLTERLLHTKFRDPGEPPKLHLFGQLKRIAKDWLDTCLTCKGNTYPAQLMYQELADMACNRITNAITRAFEGARPIKALLSAYNPTGSSAHVRFNTSRTDLWETDARRCQVNWVVLDSDWEVSSAGWPRPIHGSGPTSKTTTSALKSRTCMGRSPGNTSLTSSSWWTTAGRPAPTARPTCCTSSLKSRATAARTRKSRKTPWTPTGCPA